MPNPATERKTSRLWRAAGWVLLAALLLVALRPVRMHFKPDAAVYALVGSEVLHGSVMYRDVWDNKGPALLFLYTGLYAIFGNRAFLFDVVLTFWVVLSAYLAFLVARRLRGYRAGISAAVLMAFACAFPPGRDLNAEMAGLPAVLLGMHLLLSGFGRRRARRFVGAGAAFAVALLTKPVFALDALAALVGLVLWVRARRSKGTRRERVLTTGAMLGLAGGGIIGVLPFAAYFVYHGAVQDWWEVYVLSNFAYVQMTAPREALRSAIAFLEGPVGQLSVLWALAVIGTMTLRSVGRPKHERTLLLAWFIATILGVLLGRRFFPHYLAQAFGPASVLGGCAIGMLWDSLKHYEDNVRRLAMAFTVSLLIVAAGPLVVRLYNSAHGWRTADETDSYVENEERTAEYLKQNTRQDDRIFVVGMNAQLSLLTGLRPASRFIYTRFLYDAAAGPVRDRTWRMWRQDMETNRPVYVIISNYNRLLEIPEGQLVSDPEFAAWLAENYHFERALRGAAGRTTYNNLFRRNESGGEDSGIIRPVTPAFRHQGTTG